MQLSLQLIHSDSCYSDSCCLSLSHEHSKFPRLVMFGFRTSMDVVTGVFIGDSVLELLKFALFSKQNKLRVLHDVIPVSPIVCL